MEAAVYCIFHLTCVSDFPSAGAPDRGGEPGRGWEVAGVREGELCAVHLQWELELGHAQRQH